jgi:hypothetical protein
LAKQDGAPHGAALLLIDTINDLVSDDGAALAAADIIDPIFPTAPRSDEGRTSHHLCQ